jgi:D-erythrulose 4-kinase
MTRLFNAPGDFVEEMIEGLVAAYPGTLRAVSGGVVRRSALAGENVAVVIGGGSGHYPAFAGLVGPGLAAGAAMGNIFASPSAHQVYSVARAADRGHGVLLSFGNYAGDVLNFGAAQDRLRREGIDCRTVLVTDDISTAPASERDKRRGVAGDLVVFKVAGARAAEGADLDEVERAARSANDRTRTLGVAFSGCMLPGAEAPLFDVPKGMMSVGLGIHGEPGLEDVPLPTAQGLAELLVGRLLAEPPSGVGTVAGARIAVILNGLGTVKYEELFVVYRSIASLLIEAGVDIVTSDVGEFCTSFDMAGASLTIVWLDDELERLWTAPAESAALRRGRIGALSSQGDGSAEVADGEVDIEPGSAESRAAASLAFDALVAAEAVISENADELGRIDSVAGDGDHGLGMTRGIRAAVTAAAETRERGAGVRTMLERAADGWADTGGGTSGVLWGVVLRSIGESLSDQQAPDRTGVAEAVAVGIRALTAFGKAQVGDKTMVDAAVPFADTLGAEIASGRPLGEAWRRAVAVALQAASDTADLLPRVGRARPHAERSLGTPDAGAMSFAMIVGAVATVLDSTALSRHHCALLSAPTRPASTTRRSSGAVSRRTPS